MNNCLIWLLLLFGCGNCGRNNCECRNTCDNDCGYANSRGANRINNCVCGNTYDNNDCGCGNSYENNGCGCSSSFENNCDCGCNMVNRDIDDCDCDCDCHHNHGNSRCTCGNHVNREYPGFRNDTCGCEEK